MIKIWGRSSAYNVQKVLWTIGELELPYQHINAGGSVGGLDQPEFLGMNPNGRIPVIVDDNITIWESNSIVRYLCAQYSHDWLWAKTPAKRSLAERWMDWELATLQPDFLDLFWSFYRTPEALHDHQKIQNASERCQKHLAMLDAHLAEQTFLAGDEFSMGDIPVATSLYRYFEMGIPTPQIPNVRRWNGALAERKPYREHIMTPFDELCGRQTF
ncbi:glutathione S-transferase family protein [Methylomonas sp. MK1]|uniref:glutathione S-transferase family protein n=1 Tax=Methylomonas sp. MK1 TaxID=1131552 RepID=UPI00035CD4E2|nr:glutathione S-transferase family protein [Methylomonas sp. MK1]